MPLTNYQESEILKWMFGISSPSVPSLLYAGLSTTNPTDQGSGSTEPVGGNYNRVAIPTGPNFWTYASDNSIKNGTVIQFGTTTASWGQVQSVPFFDQASGGSIRFYGSLNPSQIMNSNEVLKFEVNDLRVFL